MMLLEDQELLHQTEILALLHKDRNRGAELLLETYTPLLWTVCQRRLANPEDIREVVNDVFTYFCMDPDKYDPTQASLKNYLAMIADRKAISYYRSNQRRSEAEAAANDVPPDQTELHRELEDALALLQPEDAQIIRLKYYGGMTYREIAAQMGIAEETVKKRGSRSLRKMAKWLIIGLILASLLAGCAYVVHRYFRYSKGIGISWDTEVNVYQLAEPVEPITANGVTIHLLSVSYTEDSVVATMAYRPADESLDDTAYNMIAHSYQMSINGGEAEDLLTSSDVMGEYLIPIPSGTLTPDENGKISLHLELTPDNRSAEVLTTECGFEMDRSALTLDIVLEETEIQQSLTDLGYYLETDYADFLVMTDHAISTETGDTYTLVSLYPIFENEDYTLSNQISACITQTQRIEREQITLTDSSGNVYPLYRTITPSRDSVVTEYTLWFQNVPAGEYTLNIPSLCYQFASEVSPVTLPLPTEDGIPLSIDQTLPLSETATLHFESVTLRSEHKEASFLIESWVDGVQTWNMLEDTQTVRYYSFAYEVITDEEFPFYGATLTAQFAHVTEEGLSYIDYPWESETRCDGVDQLYFAIRDGLGLDAPDAVTASFVSFFYADPQDYSIPLKIN